MQGLLAETSMPLTLPIVILVQLEPQGSAYQGWVKSYDKREAEKSLEKIKLQCRSPNISINSEVGSEANTAQQNCPLKPKWLVC